MSVRVFIFRKFASSKGQTSCHTSIIALVRSRLATYLGQVCYNQVVTTCFKNSGDGRRHQTRARPQLDDREFLVTPRRVDEWRIERDIVWWIDK